MQANFPAILAMLLIHEGGYVDHPKDPGSATKYGITFQTLQAWRGTPITKADVRRLTKDEAGCIYAARYWAPIRGDALPAGVDCSVMDFGVNAGVARAVRLLQGLAGVSRDGQMGPGTLAAIEEAIVAQSTAGFLRSYAKLRSAYYRSLKTFPTFGQGWLNRNALTLAQSLALALVAAPAAPQEGV